ncbi:hypothetical protein Gogos_009457 [Gossypium gossypioides]|uniref:Uncharacterized protein n=1 Tax=Gossypium gossypioides TaxID=34282 RepID=A0A7J9CEV6_GOSGO|nr:hypothetical protein [Gossypium gossypioides]
MVDAHGNLQWHQINNVLSSNTLSYIFFVKYLYSFLSSIPIRCRSGMADQGFLDGLTSEECVISLKKRNGRSFMKKLTATQMC